MLEEQGKCVQRIYFPEDGIISVMVETGGQRIAVALIGYEGMTGGAIVLSDGQAAFECQVQIAGDAHWISVSDLRGFLDERSTVRTALLRYFHVFGIEVAHTALANGRFSIGQRLARWLLMADDRMDHMGLPITHDLLASMIGVRRPGVTDALHRLEGEHAIKSTRGHVAVLNRKALIDLAGGSYGFPELEAFRLLRAWTLESSLEITAQSQR
jgi:CRP-like cAMP-binding protein